jgi:two-component system NtrC family sensor kinase
VISVETKNLDHAVEIRIKDNGIGMPPHIAKQLFTPFFTTKPPGEGTGLGLSLSYNIIAQEHGGTMDFKTEDGEFTEFIITIPKPPLN